MSKDSVIVSKSLHFAARIVRLYRRLSSEHEDTLVFKRMLRSGTSIGVYANEAIYGISRENFITKLQMSLRETAETEYWLRLLALSDYISEGESALLIADCLELKRILNAYLRTAKEST